MLNKSLYEYCGKDSCETIGLEIVVSQLGQWSTSMLFLDINP